MKKLMSLTLSCLLAGTWWACETRPTTETADREREDTAVVTPEDSRASRELNEFKTWVNEKADGADSTARENWPQVKEEFKQRVARLDRRADSLSAEGKAEYQELKREFQRWEAQQQQRTSQPLDPARLQQWEKALLDNKTVSAIGAADMREMYLTFMGVVRAKKNRWTQDDWDYVDHIYSRLNARKDQVESAIPTTDRIKIKTLQAEYLALEAGSDAKDLYQHVKE